MDRGHVPHPRAQAQHQAGSGSSAEAGGIEDSQFFTNELCRTSNEALIEREFDTVVLSELDNQGREITQMVSDAQVKFFDKLLDEKDFGDVDTTKLREQFGTLNQKSGSLWIERAIALPKRDESGEAVVEPSF